MIGSWRLKQRVVNGRLWIDIRFAALMYDRPVEDLLRLAQGGRVRFTREQTGELFLDQYDLIEVVGVGRYSSRN